VVASGVGSSRQRAEERAADAALAILTDGRDADAVPS
jgi:dsRNA-specific ribonuclease